MINFASENDIPSYDSLASSTMFLRLSNELINFLYKDLGAKFERREDVKESYRWESESDIKTYLGTYWPKTFAEVFAIFSSYFNMEDSVDNLKNKSEISILDIGSNSLPATIALLYALKNFSSKVKKINVFVIELNISPVFKGIEIIRKFFPKFVVNIKIRNLDFLKCVSDKCGFNKKMDFILCSKIGNELYLQGDESCYTDAVNFAEKCLEKDGIFYLSDVTMRSPKGVYFPQMMNNQVIEYLRGTPQLIPIFPVPCGFYGSTCKVRDCFTQVVLNIDSNNPNYPFEAKFSPKLFLHKENAERFLQKHFNPNDSYTVANASRYGLKVCENKR